MPQLLLLAAVFYILYRWLRGGSRPARTRPAQRPSPAAGVEEMAQDPACGTWVPLSQAVTLRRGGETLHFCSAECRDRHVREANKRDA